MRNIYEWEKALDERQQKEVAFARDYTINYHHGTDGHSRLTLIERLERLTCLLDDREDGANTPR